MKIPSLILAISFLFGSTALGAPCGGGGGGRTLVVAAGGQAAQGAYKSVAEALKAAQPGDTVLLKPGKYKGGISFPRSGTAGKCITLKGEKGAEISGGSTGISISSKNYIAVVGLNVNTIRGGDMPTGIKVGGSSSHIELRDNVVDRVTSNSNAHGISFYGTSQTPMSDLLIEGNEVKNCKLGQSEALVLNGNVTNFVINRNKVHDNDNIGIDIIGHEGKGPRGQDYARGGKITNNQVWNCSSGKNPTYGGERSAGGIYVDGGQGIEISNNQVKDSDIGIELASEHAGKSTSGIIVKGNSLSNSFQGNLMMGGYAANKGKATNILVEGNSFANGRDAEIILQHNTSGITIKGNTFQARAGRKNILATGRNNVGLLVQGNRYAAKPGSGDLASKDGTFQQIQSQALANQRPASNNRAPAGSGRTPAAQARR